MGPSTEPIEQIDWFERYENPACLNHQPINSDALEGGIRNPIQLEEVVARVCSGPVCSLPFEQIESRPLFIIIRIISINSNESNDKQQYDH